MALIHRARAPHTERQDEEAKANHGARRTGTPWNIFERRRQAS
jgi:hypothetical protein